MSEGFIITLGLYIILYALKTPAPCHVSAQLILLTFGT